MKQTQVQSFIQPVQVQTQSHKSQVQGKQGAVDFLQVLQQLISGNAAGTAGRDCFNNIGMQAGLKGNQPNAPEIPAKICCNPGDVENTQAFYELTQPAPPGDLSTLQAAVTEKTPEKNINEQALMDMLALLLGETLQQIRENGQIPVNTFSPASYMETRGEATFDSMLITLLNPDRGGTLEQVNADTGNPPGISQQVNALLGILERVALETPGGNSPVGSVNRFGINREHLQQILHEIQNPGQKVTNRNDLYQALKDILSNPTPLPGNKADLSSFTTGPGKIAAPIEQTAPDYFAGQNITCGNKEQLNVGDQLSADPRSWLKNYSDTKENGLYQQQGSNIKTTAVSSHNAGDAVKPNQGRVVYQTVNRTVNTAGSEFNMTSPASAATKPETATNAQRTETVHFTLNSVESTLSPAKPASGEAAPVVRAEQPLFLQLADAIRGQAIKDSQGRTHLRLQLHPESLGEVVVKVVYKDGNLTAHFQAATEGARQVIESSFAQLREALATHQLNLQHSTVSTGSDHGNWAQESSGERHFNRPFGQQRVNKNKEQVDSLPETVIETQQTDHPNRLNHFV